MSMPSRIVTSAAYPHSPEEVWAVLADFERYRDWNPLNVEAHGEAKVGAKVWMRLANPAKPGTFIKMTVTITRCVPGRALEWRGHIPFLFTGDHAFTLQPEGGGTALLHTETLSGAVPRFVFGHERIDRLWPPAYDGMNRALGARLEALLPAARA